MDDLSQHSELQPKRSAPKNPGLRNEKKVLSLLHQGRPLTQTGLCRLTGLNSSTVSYTVARLREKGLILEEQGKSRSRGAKPILISINPAGRYIIGVEINPSHLFIGVFDYNAQLIDSVRSSISPLDQHPPSMIIEMIEITIRGLLGRHKIDSDKMCGIGITLSGSISPTGDVHLSSPLGWKHIPLQKMLQDRFRDIKVTVLSTRVRLLAEMNLAKKTAFKNVLYINIANGVGGSVFLDGNLIQGATGRTGEIGHIVVDPEGPQCGCGNRGCLEALVSGPAIANKMRQDLKDQDTSLARAVSGNEIPETIISHWGKAIQEGDAYAITLSVRVASYIAQVAAVSINCYDPDMIILAGYVSREITRQLTEAIQRELGRSVFDAEGRSIKIAAAQSGETSLIQGVASAILHDYIHADF